MPPRGITTCDALWALAGEHVTFEGIVNAPREPPAAERAVVRRGREPLRTPSRGLDDDRGNLVAVLHVGHPRSSAARTVCQAVALALSVIDGERSRRRGDRA